MTASRAATDLDLYELAWLAGGPARVVDTALVALVRSGRIRAHSPGELATVELTRRHPVEAAVLDAVGPSGHRSVDTIRWRVAADDRILGIGRRLQHDGLVARFALGGVLHPGASVRTPTRAGRRALQSRRAGAAAGGAELQVALGGRDALPDRALHASIFDKPRSKADLAHGLDFADGAVAAGRTRAAIVADANRLGGWMGQ
jgi:hypothetical protein